MVLRYPNQHAGPRVSENLQSTASGYSIVMIKTIAMWERLKRRYTRLFFVVGGVFFIIDQIGRIQTIEDLYAMGKTWFSSRSNIHINWPPHTLLGIGVFFVLLGAVSFFLPDRKQSTNPFQTVGEDTLTSAPQQAELAAPSGTKSAIDMNPPLPDAAGLINTGPGPNKLLIKRIMRGTEKPMAWEIIREKLPNVFFVEFSIRNLEPNSCVTADYKVANAQWHEWYKLWKKQPGGFGGAFGEGLDGTLPW